MTKEVLCGKCDNCGHEHYIKLYKTFCFVMGCQGIPLNVDEYVTSEKYDGKYYYCGKHDTECKQCFRRGKNYICTMHRKREKKRD